MRRIAFLKLAIIADSHGDYRLSDRLVKLAQYKDFERATGSEMDSIRRDLKSLYAKSGRVSPEQIREMLRKKYYVTISDERLRTLMSDEERRHNVKYDPYVDRVGELVLERGLNSEQIANELKGVIDEEDVVKKWKQFAKEHPEVEANLLRRPDVVRAKPSGRTDVELKDRIRENQIPEGTNETEVLRHQIGEASGDPKIQMMSDPDRDAAAMETYRLSLLPEFQRPDGSLIVAKLAAIIGGSDTMVHRRLKRAYRIMANKDTRIFRQPEDREAARDLVSQLAAQGYSQRRLLEALNEMRMGEEPEWTDNNLFALFRYTDGQKIGRVVPVNRWPDYRSYIEEARRKPPVEDFEEEE